MCSLKTEVGLERGHGRWSQGPAWQLRDNDHTRGLLLRRLWILACQAHGLGVYLSTGLLLLAVEPSGPKDHEETPVVPGPDFSSVLGGLGDRSA